MALPSPNLDDLRFQRDLVDNARRRIIHYCPDWTEYNLSDPGITLIELFAWMTETIIYRLNQVPEKNYIEFLNLLGMQRQPASSARADLTFWLSVSLPISSGNNEPVIVPQGIGVSVSSWAFVTDGKVFGKKEESFVTPLNVESEDYPTAERRVQLETYFFVNDLTVKRT